MRDFLDAMQDKILHIPVDSPGILKDLDTPEDYQSQKPVKQW
jgi:CTP:molybdopterin cytidylyltransferase MocA